MEHVIPQAIANFVLDKIDSIAELEALLILRQSAPAKWSPRALASRLYISESQTNDVLRALCDKSLAAADSENPASYFYAPADAKLASTVQTLADIYSKQLVPVTNLIHSKAKHRVRGFADAFKFRKDD